MVIISQITRVLSWIPKCIFNGISGSHFCGLERSKVIRSRVYRVKKIKCSDLLESCSKLCVYLLQCAYFSRARVWYYAKVLYTLTLCSVNLTILKTRFHHVKRIQIDRRVPCDGALLKIHVVLQSP